MDLIKITSELTKKDQEPKIFAVLFKHSGQEGTMMLHVVMTYALELAYQDFMQKLPQNLRVGSWFPILWSATRPEDMVKGLEEIKIQLDQAEKQVAEPKPEKPKKETKNQLMKRIIDTNDKELFAKNLDRFNEHEVKLIQDKLK